MIKHRDRLLPNAVTSVIMILRVAEGRRTRAFLRLVRNLMSITNYQPEEDEYPNYEFIKWPQQ